jgi:hypothetical protein
MSSTGMATEEISRLVGHSSSHTTETVYVESCGLSYGPAQTPWTSCSATQLLPRTPAWI